LHRRARSDIITLAPRPGLGDPLRLSLATIGAEEAARLFYAAALASGVIICAWPATGTGTRALSTMARISAVLT